VHRRLTFALLTIALGALALTLAPGLAGFDAAPAQAHHRPGHGGSGGGGGGTPPMPEPCVGCPPMFVRSIVVGAGKNVSGSTYANCRVIMWDENGNTLEGVSVLHEWSGAGSGQVVDETAPNPPYATSTLVTFNDGPKCKGRNASQIYTCTVLDAASADYTYVPASNWESADSDEACTP
jgi:hypothetical protein